MKRIRIISLLFILAFVTVTAVLDTFGIMSYDKMMILLGLRDPAFTSDGKKYFQIDTYGSPLQEK